MGDHESSVQHSTSKHCDRKQITTLNLKGLVVHPCETQQGPNKLLRAEGGRNFPESRLREKGDRGPSII
jgi:hypothetical protein